MGDFPAGEVEGEAGANGLWGELPVIGEVASELAKSILVGGEVGRLDFGLGAQEVFDFQGVEAATRKLEQVRSALGEFDFGIGQDLGSVCGEERATAGDGGGGDLELPGGVETEVDAIERGADAAAGEGGVAGAIVADAASL